MNTEIYWFSGTGNSLAIAKDMNNRFKGSLIAIPSTENEKIIRTDAEKIGIFFPVYNQGIPSIVSRFIKKLKTSEDAYVFAVCTFGGSKAGIVIEYLQKELEAVNIKLSGGFTIKMPYNYIEPSFKIKGFFESFKLKETDKELQQKLFKEAHHKVNGIIRYVSEKRTDSFENDSIFVEHLIDKLNLRETLQKKAWLRIAGVRKKTDLSFRDSVNIMDTGFWNDEHCISCGTCLAICPVNNISYGDMKIIWHHHCEQCFACLQWCPRYSIQFRKGTREQKRYHHPDIKAAELFHQTDQ